MISSGSDHNGVNQENTVNHDHLLLTKNLRERSRRDKINSLIMELKDIVRDTGNLTNQEFSKLERADILELAIKHIKARSTNESLNHSFYTGITFCAAETMNFLQHYETSTVFSSNGPQLLAERVKIILGQQKIEHNVQNVFESERHCLHEVNKTRSSRVQHQREVMNCDAMRTKIGTGKREVLEKIRRKIFEKRRVRNMIRRRANADPNLPFMDDGFMWRPW